MLLSDFSFHFSDDCSHAAVKSSLRPHIFLLVVWSSCFNTSLTGKSQVMGSSQTVLAKVGDDVTLPCYIQPSVDASQMTVQWTRPDLKPQYVHALAEGREVFYSKNPLYTRRTFLFHEELPRGNISLKLFRVQLSDEGTYACYVPALGSGNEIQLLVGAMSQPVIFLIGIKSGLLSWTCDSGCWYPQPEVSWLDSEGNNITSEPSVTVRRSQNCFAVQTNLTMRGEERVTCRVHQPHINYTSTVETHSVIPGAVSQPVISVIGHTDDGLSLTCDSGCWYPQPEVSWLDSEGNIIPVESSETVRGSEHCYTVTTSVTVRRAGNVTCRVHQPHSATHKVISEGEMPVARGRGRHVMWPVVVLGVIVIILVVICCWKWKSKQTDPTLHSIESWISSSAGRVGDTFGPTLQKIKHSQLCWSSTSPKQKKNVIKTQDVACQTVLISPFTLDGATSEQQDKSSKQLNMVTTAIMHSDADSGYGGTLEPDGHSKQPFIETQRQHGDQSGPGPQSPADADCICIET